MTGFLLPLAFILTAHHTADPSNSRLRWMKSELLQMKCEEQAKQHSYDVWLGYDRVVPCVKEREI